MGSEQSTLEKNGYTVEKTKRKLDMPCLATKKDDTFLIKMIPLNLLPANAELTQLSPELRILEISHPHIVNNKDSFKDTDAYYVVTEYCQGGNLAQKIKEMKEPPQEWEVLSLLAEICMALRAIHTKGLLQKDLTPENIHFTEFGIVRLNGYQQIYEKSKNTSQNVTETCSYMAPEVYTSGTYNAKSDIWTVGCILYEFCTQKQAFSAKSIIELMPKILSGPYPTLPDTFSPELCSLLRHIFDIDPLSRPTATDILGCPFIISALSKKTKETVDKVQTKVDALRTLADGLESVHQGATVGSLTGGVIGAVGGITSIVGLILAPFTLGASLIVTGVGVGVGAVGGVTAGASNITKMVNESSDRRAVRSVIKNIEQNINAVITWIQEISNSLERLRSRCDAQENIDLNTANLVGLGLRAGRGISGVAELIRLVQVMNIGRIAAQASRVVRVAEVATGVLSGLFIAADIFFIAVDAKELHYIRQAKAASGNPTNKDGTDTESQNQLVQDQTPLKSEIMKFVQSTRQAADDLQEVVDEFKNILSSIPSLEDITDEDL